MGLAVYLGEAQKQSLRELLSELLGRPIPDDERIATTWAELRLYVAALKEENEMLKEEIDFLKGYPVNGLNTPD